MDHPLEKTLLALLSDPSFFVLNLHDKKNLFTTFPLLNQHTEVCKITSL